jgi:hypothetical protein
MTQKKKKLDLSGKQFDYIYKNKIQNQLDEPGKFNFKDMNILFNAYEYWRYENINNKNFKQIDQLDRQIEENLRKSSLSNDGHELDVPLLNNTKKANDLPEIQEVPDVIEDESQHQDEPIDWENYPKI